jgi:hypothetical protein
MQIHVAWKGRRNRICDLPGNQFRSWVYSIKGWNAIEIAIVPFADDAIKFALQQMKIADKSIGIKRFARNRQSHLPL